MENIVHICYNSRHETFRNRTTAGKAASAGNPAVKSGQESAGSSSCSKLFRKFCLPMVSNISKKGAGRIEVPTHSRPSAQAYQGAERQARKSVTERSPSRWLSNGHVDAPACGRSDRPSVRYTVSSIPCLEASGQSGMELPETGAPRSAARRRKNHPLEAVPMASYKKTRQNVEPIWRFLMKAAFCSSLLSGAPGLPRGKRPTCTISTNGIGCPPSAPLQYPRKESESLCISGISPEISTASISETFSLFCSNIFAGRSSYYGIGHLFTTEKKSSGSLPAIRDCMSKTSRPMRQSSILQNMCGTRPTLPSPTAHRGTYRNFAECCAPLSGGSGDHKSSSGPASMPQIYRGQDSYFHYFCKDQ